MCYVQYSFRSVGPVGVGCGMLCFFFQAEDGIRYSSVTGVQTCAFFFQAEDGIRDSSVTGVQTCALPICRGKAAMIDIWVGSALFGPRGLGTFPRHQNAVDVTFVDAGVGDPHKLSLFV